MVHTKITKLKSNHLCEYPKVEKKNDMSGLICNFKRNDLFVEKNIVKDHFKQ